MDLIDTIDVVKKIQKRKAFLKYIDDLQELFGVWETSKILKNEEEKKQEIDKAFNIYQNKIKKIDDNKL